MNDDFKVYRQLGALAQAARNAILSRNYASDYDLRVLDRLAAEVLGVPALLKSPADLTSTCATGAEPVGEPPAPTGAYQEGQMTAITGALEFLLGQGGR